MCRLGSISTWKSFPTHVQFGMPVYQIPDVPCDRNIAKVGSLEERCHLLGSSAGCDRVCVVQVETATDFVALNERHYLRTQDVGSERVFVFDDEMTCTTPTRFHRICRKYRFARVGEHLTGRVMKFRLATTPKLTACLWYHSTAITFAYLACTFSEVRSLASSSGFDMSYSCSSFFFYAI